MSDEPTSKSDHLKVVPPPPEELDEDGHEFRALRRDQGGNGAAKPDPAPAEPIQKPEQPVTPPNPFANLDALRNPQDYEDFLGGEVAASFPGQDLARGHAPAGEP